MELTHGTAFIVFRHVPHRLNHRNARLQSPLRQATIQITQHVANLKLPPATQRFLGIDVGKRSDQGVGTTEGDEDPGHHKNHHQIARCVRGSIYPLAKIGPPALRCQWIVALCSDIIGLVDERSNAGQCVFEHSTRQERTAAKGCD